MSFDFVANEGDCWVSASIPPASPNGAEATRNRTGVSIAAGGSLLESRVLTPRTAGEVVWRTFFGSTFAINITQHYWKSSSGIQVVRIRNTATNTQQLQYWNGSAWVGVGAAQVVDVNSLLYRARLMYSGLGTTSGTLTFMYTNVASGLVVNSWTATGLNLTSCPDIAQAGVEKTTNGIYTIHEYVMSGDAALDGTVVHSGVGTGAGTDNVNAVGTFAAIDDGASSNPSSDDSDFLQLGASGDRYSMVMPARSFGGKAVKSIVINYRAQRGGSGPQNIRPYLKISGTRYYAATQLLSAAFLSGYQAFFDLNPATAAAWTAAAAEGAALEFGFEAVP